MTQKGLVIAIIVLFTIGNVSANLKLKHQDLFVSWKMRYNKEYPTALEEAIKYENFFDNYEFISDFNQENNGVQLALNQFADMTPEEFSATFLGVKSATETVGVNNSLLDDNNDIQFNLTANIDIEVQNNAEEEAKNFLGAAQKPILGALAKSINWVTKGAVTSVKKQPCGNCWSYSASAALEAYNFIKTGKLLYLSNQQLSDCVTTCSGCNGCGGVTQALSYTAKYGIERSVDYPSTSSGAGSCKYNSAKIVFKNQGYKSVTPRSVSALKTALNVQPVQIALQANDRVFQFYSSGVIKSGCGANLNHAILAVGYTTINGVEAFYVKNQWGTEWGINGFGYISASPTANNGYGVCGILSMAAYPV